MLPAMRRHLGVTVIALLASALVAAPAWAWTPTAAQLAVTMKREFARQLKQQAPTLKVGKVTCKIAKNKKTGRCLARVSAKAQGVNVVYTIVARNISSAKGSVSWETTGHTCTSIKTGKPVACGAPAA
jgi:hypothetical protein